MHGDADPWVPLELSRSYATHHPSARLVELPATGHLALIDPESKAWPTILTELATF